MNELKKIKQLIDTGARPSTWENERGNTITNAYIGSVDRYQFDSQLCTKDAGFEQFDTDQDASYFGVWVNRKERVTLTYSEGDLTLVTCPSSDTFRAEIQDAERVYGTAPPMAIGLDPSSGEVTNFFDDRVSAEDLS